MLALAGLLLLPVLAAPENVRVAVIAIDSDPLAAGQHEARLVEELEAVPGLSTVRGASLGASFGFVQPKVSAGPEQSQLMAALERVRSAYYDDRVAETAAALAEAEALDARAPAAVTAALRTDVRLWRATVSLSANRADEARASIRDALSLAPGLEVDLQRFPVVVKELADTVRAQGVGTATVRLTGLPPGARVLVDDRPVESTFQVAPGAHVIDVRATGHRPYRAAFETIGPETAIAMALPTGADPVRAAALDTLLVNGTGESSLLAAAGTDVLVVVRSKTAMVAWKGKHPVRVGSDAVRARIEADLVRLRQQQEEAVRRASSAPTTAPVAVAPRGRPPAASPRSRAAEIETQGSLLAVTRLRRVEGRGGAFSTGAVAAGPSIAIAARRERWVVEGEGAYVSFQGTQYEARFADGTSESTTGGTSARLRAGGGPRQRLGEATLELTVGLTYEVTHEPALPRRAEGFNPSHARTAADVRAGLRVPIGPRQRGRFHGGVGIAPWSTWRESPSGASGSSPRPLPSLGGWAAIDWQVGERLMAGFAWRGEMRSVRFRGEARLPADPPVEDARLDEITNAMAATVSVGF